MKKITGNILIFAILMSLFTFNVSASGTPIVASEAQLLVELSSTSPLFARNELEPMYPASTTKIMTALVVLDEVAAGNVSLDDMVTATSNMHYDLIAAGSSVGIVVGEEMSLGDLLYCAMLASGNDACNVIAEHVGGTIENFVLMMNQKAIEEGCTGSNFTNAHGLHNEQHYTTAVDLARITYAAYQHDTFMEIVGTAEYTVPATNMSGARALKNSNGLLATNTVYGDRYLYGGAIGVKTGFTTPAGYCLVSMVERDDVQLMCIVLNGKTEGQDFTNFSDSVALYDWGFNNFGHREVVSTLDVMETLEVTGAKDDNRLDLVPQHGLSAYLRNTVSTDRFEMDVTVTAPIVNHRLQAPIVKGETIGYVTVKYEEVIYGTIPLVAARDVEQTFGDLVWNSFLDLITNRTFAYSIVAACIFVLALVIFKNTTTGAIWERRFRRIIRKLRNNRKRYR